MKRRDFLKTMGVGAASLALSGSVLSSCGGKTLKALPSFGTITGSNGAWHPDGALAGLKKLRKNRYKFPIPEAVKKELAKYKSTINPLIEYLADNIEASPNDRVLNKDLYKDYVDWADGEDDLKEGREFMGKLKVALDNAGIKYKNGKSNGNNCLIGIKLKKDPDTDDVQDADAGGEHSTGIDKKHNVSKVTREKRYSV